MTTRLNWIDEELEALKKAGTYKTIRTLSTPQGAWLEVDGKKVLNFCSNNYLGLANHPHMVKVAKEAIDKYGVGPGAVRPIAGTMEIHLELEKRLAKFKGVESALTFQSGFCANLASIPAIVGKEDVIYSDELNHASIIDGSRLSRATIVRFKHADADDLRKVILENKDKYRRGLAITDGVFSMDGDLAPLDKIYEVTSQYDVILMVDDAHGEGVVGKGGRGIVDHFNLHGKVDLEIGTFSKAFGVMGGVAAGSQSLIEYLRQVGRPFTFSSAATPADVAATIGAVDLLETSTQLVDKLWDNAKYFQGELKRLGFNTGVSVTPITPVILGDELLTQKFSKALFDADIFASSIAFPIVARGAARIRVMLSATHSREDLDFALEAFTKAGKALGII